MKTRLVVVLAMAVGMLMGTQLFAHHGTGISYDMKKTVTVKGVVTKFAFQNPHSQLYFDVKDDQGNVVHWAAEMRAPGNLEANGYTRRGLMEKLAPGANVTVTGNPSKVGAPVMVFIKAVLDDGYCVCKDGGGGRENQTQGQQGQAQGGGYN
jgi:Family of unknown function (DUF6152)